MSLLTQWGYTLTDSSSLEDMLSVTEYDWLTGNRYGGDIRIPGNIKAACSAIRNYCGWHVYPSEACEATMLLNDRRVTITGGDLLIQLPSRFLTDVSSITIDGDEYTTFSFETYGLVRVYDVNFCGMERFSPIVIDYTSGLSEEMMDGIKELIAHRVTHAAASSNGITSEAAGGVSVTYNANWINSARATALPDDNKEVLSPYRVQGVF